MGNTVQRKDTLLECCQQHRTRFNIRGGTLSHSAATGKDHPVVLAEFISFILDTTPPLNAIPSISNAAPVLCISHAPLCICPILSSMSNQPISARMHYLGPSLAKPVPPSHTHAVSTQDFTCSVAVSHAHQMRCEAKCRRYPASELFFSHETCHSKQYSFASLQDAKSRTREKEKRKIETVALEQLRVL